MLLEDHNDKKNPETYFPQNRTKIILWVCLFFTSEMKHNWINMVKKMSMDISFDNPALHLKSVNDRTDTYGLQIYEWKGKGQQVFEQWGAPQGLAICKAAKMYCLAHICNTIQMKTTVKTHSHLKPPQKSREKGERLYSNHLVKENEN